MERTPDDALISIFQAYLEEPSTMLVSFMPVCKRWYNLINTTPILCSRIVIKSKIEGTVIFDYSSKGLEKYLRTTDGTNVPLEIDIQSFLRSTELHNLLCYPLKYDYLTCYRSPCLFIEHRRSQLEKLLALLADAESYTKGHSTEVPVKSRIKRWKSLSIETDGSYEECNNQEGVTWLKNPSRCAPRLSHLTFRAFTPWYRPHDAFAPNLTDLVIDHIPFGTDNSYSIIQLPSLRRLEMHTRHSIDWDKVSGICSIEELIITEMFESSLTTTVQFPNLKRLMIRQNVTKTFILKISEDFRQYNRRLDVVYFHNFIPPMWLEQASILTNARKVFFERESKIELSINPFTKGIFGLFLARCAPDTDIVALDKNSAEMLAAAQTALSETLE